MLGILKGYLCNMAPRRADLVSKFTCFLFHVLDSPPLPARLAARKAVAMPAVCFDFQIIRLFYLLLSLASILLNYFSPMGLKANKDGKMCV